MGLAGFGKGLAEGYEKGNQMRDRKQMRDKANTMHKGKSGAPQSRGADGATGAGAANEPMKKVKNLQHSKKKGMTSTNGGWHNK